MQSAPLPPPNEPKRALHNGAPMRAEDPRALAKRIAGCFRETRASAATGGGAAGGGAGWLYGRGNRTLAHASDVTTSVKHSILYLDNLKVRVSRLAAPL